MTEFVGAAFVTPLHTTIRVYDEDRQPVSDQIRLNTDCHDAKMHLLRLTGTLKAEARKHSSDAKVSEVGIAVAGRVSDGVITQASRLHQWKGTRIDKIVSQALSGARVAVGNDAEARMLWESTNNPTVAGGPFMALYWGEGIGAAHMGYFGKTTTLEPGHMLVEGLPTHKLLPCACSTHPGCLDAHAGGARIGEELRKSGRPFLSVEDATEYASLVAGVVSKLLKKYPSDYLVIGGQRLKLHENLGKGNPSLAALLEHQIAIRTNQFMRPQVVRSQLWYAPADTALTLLDRSAKSLAAVR